MPKNSFQTIFSVKTFREVYFLVVKSLFWLSYLVVGGRPNFVGIAFIVAYVK